MHICPVCGYDKMLRPASAGYICPCCGVEFEVDDDELSHAELRRKWISDGMRWFSGVTHAPAGWNPIVQLVRAGHLDEVYALEGSPLHLSRAVSVGSCVSGSIAPAP